MLWHTPTQTAENPSGFAYPWIISPDYQTLQTVQCITLSTYLTDRVVLTTSCLGDTMPYSIGSNVTMKAEFISDDTDTDPTTIIFTLYKDGTETVSYTYGTDAELVRSSAGIYYVDYALADSGWYQWNMAGTGTVIARAWQSFVCLPDPV